MDINPLQLFGNTFIDGTLLLGDWDVENECMRVDVMITPSFKIGFGDRKHDYEYDVYIPCYVHFYRSGKVKVHSLYKDGDIEKEMDFNLIPSATWYTRTAKEKKLEKLLPFGTGGRTAIGREVEAFANVIDKYCRTSYLRACQIATSKSPEFHRAPSLIGSILEMYMEIIDFRIAQPDIDLAHLGRNDDLGLYIKAELSTMKTTNWWGFFDRVKILDIHTLSLIKAAVSKTDFKPIDSSDNTWGYPVAE